MYTFDHRTFQSVNATAPLQTSSSLRSSVNSMPLKAGIGKPKPFTKRSPFSSIGNIQQNANQRNVKENRRPFTNKKLGGVHGRSLNGTVVKTEANRSVNPSRAPFSSIANSNIPRKPQGLKYTTVASRKTRPVAVIPKSNYRITIYESETNPKDDFLEKFKKVMNRYPTGTGYIDIKGVIQEDNLKENPDFDLNKFEFTETQIRQIRILITPKERFKVMDEMGKLILGDEFHRRKRVFSPGFSHFVLRVCPKFQQQYTNTMEKPERFNLLFGFTYHLSRNPRWMTHHGRGWGGEKMVASLAKRWRELFKKSSAQELGLDLEFSYPAVLTFLQEFKEVLAKVETYGDPRLRFEFN